MNWCHAYFFPQNTPQYSKDTSLHTSSVPTLLQAYPVGPLFKGVKMVPPGPHFVGYNAGSKHNEYAPTVGFFVHLGASQVEVRAWNAPAEQLEPLEDEQQVWP